jgi:hypothetical protein
MADKHKLLQILAKPVRNAKQGLAAAETADETHLA